MHNTGREEGTPDADIDAPEAWDINTGGPVVVAVIDSGIDYTHEDLAANIWQNTDEVTGDANGDGYPGIQGVDDDGDGLVDEDSGGRQPGDPGYTNDLYADDDENGYPDDIRGWNFCTNTNDPMDTFGHGTHCAGTIGATGDNGKGVAGVNWNVRLMPLKFIGAWWGQLSDAIKAIESAIMNGAHISSNSWGGYYYSEGLRDAIETARLHDHLFIAAAGNDNNDNDVNPHYPSSFDLDNIIAVAATDRNDHRVNTSQWGSNYGEVSVDLGAPDSIILSSVPGSSYEVYSGTSMATPHVTGVASLLLAANPVLSYTQVKNIILDTVDSLPDLAGKTVTGGRLNTRGAVENVDLFINPNYMNFGEIKPGGTRTMELTVYNYTTNAVQVTLSTDTPVFTPMETSFTAPPGTRSVDIRFSAEEEERYPGLLTCTLGTEVRE
jgi:subtilisin family serine protease